MLIRDRIKELRRIPASQLRPSPKNWRTHPPAQRDALRGLLAEVGFADAALVRELEDGSLELIDGHLRTEESGDSPIPVLVLDVTEAEAEKLLLTIDPLAAMATANVEKLDGLMRVVQTGSAAVADMLAGLAKENKIVPLDDKAVDQQGLPMPTETWQILVVCENEDEQRELLTRFTDEGLTCRSLIS